MPSEATYSTGLVKHDDGQMYRVWVMEEAGHPVCANPACRGELDSQTCLSLRFPANKEKPITDMMYFCCWGCLATFVALNDAGLTVTESLGVGAAADASAPPV